VSDVKSKIRSGAEKMADDIARDLFGDSADALRYLGVGSMREMLKLPALEFPDIVLGDEFDGPPEIIDIDECDAEFLQELKKI